MSKYNLIKSGTERSEEEIVRELVTAYRGNLKDLTYEIMTDLVREIHYDSEKERLKDLVEKYKDELFTPGERKDILEDYLNGN